MEKKYVTAMQEKVGTYIHDDITFSILSKLPIKSLKRFGCVRKSWSLLFENPFFMNMVRTNLLSDDPSYHHNVSLMLLRQNLYGDIYTRVLYSFSGEKFENTAKLILPNPFQEGSETPYRFYRFEIFDFGGFNDFICVKCFLRSKYTPASKYESYARFALWNPTTEEFKVIPHSPNRIQPFAANGSHDVINFYSFSYACGFGYDSRTDDYKMINYVMFLAPPSYECIGYKPLGDTPEPFWKIYSLRSNSWRKLDVVMPLPIKHFSSTRDKVYMNGMCHWLGIIMHSDSEFETKLVSFDLNKEVFFTTPIPLDIDDGSLGEGSTQKQLVVLNGYIALITYEDQTTTCNISILGELSVKESWIKLFIVGPLHCVEEPFGMTKGKIIFRKKDREINWFDLRTQMIEVLDLKGEYCNIAVYKEDLLPIGGINK
ncbi:putative F-box domain-containing protein [Medicago truncatula]|uniref:F-box protein interaction domain protein n=1 Tax=Medicago truncatula TaxID=3880 RepID=G7K4X1_MEDTR|nr:F-box protein interaction domain protein [Medicago truncatula]RHN58134.1 putative F-box domain-containing protein [Medicago truncatula]